MLKIRPKKWYSIDEGNPKMLSDFDHKLIKEHETFTRSGGVFELPKGFLKVTGPDRVDFLHRLTTQDVKNMVVDTGAGAALLQSNASLVSFFDIYNCGQYLLLVVDKDAAASVAEFLEKYHFSEDLQIKDVSDEFVFVSVQGKTAAPALRHFLDKVPRYKREIVGNEESFVAQKGDFVADGFHLFIKSDRYQSVLKKLEGQGLKVLSLDLWKLLRAEAGYFSFGVDITDKNLILESTLSEYVSRNKGCYPGQEVVERVFTYGNVAKKLVGLHFKSAVEPVPQITAEKRVKLLNGADDAGYLTSLHFIPWSKSFVGFGMVRKPFYEPGQNLKLENDGATTEIEVAELPHSFEIVREKPAV